MIPQGHALYLIDEITTASVLPIIKEIVQRNNTESFNDEPIILYINSDGGDLDDGFALYDVIQNSTVPIYTVGFGTCYSMAAILLCSGHKRFMFENCEVMIHQPSGALPEQTPLSELYLFAKSLIANKKKMSKVVAKHTKQQYSKVFKDMNTDFYMSASMAKKYGMVDEIIKGTK